MVIFVPKKFILKLLYMANITLDTLLYDFSKNCKCFLDHLKIHNQFNEPNCHSEDGFRTCQPLWNSNFYPNTTYVITPESEF